MKESKKNDIPEGSIGKKKQRFLFFLFQKNHQNPHFSQLTEVRAFLTLSLQFLSAAPSTCIPSPKKAKKKKKKKNLSFPCVFKDSPVRVCLKTHQSVCLLRLTSRPSKAYGSRRVCFWSHWVGAVLRQTILQKKQDVGTYIAQRLPRTWCTTCH